MPFLRQWHRTGMPVLRHLLSVNLNFPPNKPEIGGGEPATYILLWMRYQRADMARYLCKWISRWWLHNYSAEATLKMLIDMLRNMQRYTQHVRTKSKSFWVDPCRPNPKIFD